MLSEKSPNLFCLILDDTECPITRSSTDTQEMYYSGKKKMHLIKYKIRVHPDSGKIVWMQDPAPEAMHDMAITEYYGLLNELDDTDVVLADKGYIGKSQIVTPIKKRKYYDLTEEEKDLNLTLGSYH